MENTSEENCVEIEKYEILRKNKQIMLYHVALILASRLEI